MSLSDKEREIDMKQNQKVRLSILQCKQLCLMHSIPVLLTYKRPYIISYPRPKELTYHVPTTDSEHHLQGLDCSGQGHCQPNMENTTGEEMQAYLVKANRSSGAKKRQQRQRKNQNISSSDD